MQKHERQRRCKLQELNLCSFDLHSFSGINSAISPFIGPSMATECTAYQSVNLSMWIVFQVVFYIIALNELNYIDLFAENFESCYDDYAKALEMLKKVVEPDSRILAEL